jgi:hypothetical protein
MDRRSLIIGACAQSALLISGGAHANPFLGVVLRLVFQGVRAMVGRSGASAAGRAVGQAVGRSAATRGAAKAAGASVLVSNLNVARAGVGLASAVVSFSSRAEARILETNPEAVAINTAPTPVKIAATGRFSSNIRLTVENIETRDVVVDRQMLMAGDVDRPFSFDIAPLPYTGLFRLRGTLESGGQFESGKILLVKPEDVWIAP